MLAAHRRLRPSRSRRSGASGRAPASFTKASCVGSRRVLARQWREAFQSGVNRILYRPLVTTQVRDALHEILENDRKRIHGDGRKTNAAKRLANIDNPNRRTSDRTGIKTLVYLELPTGTLPAVGIDLSEQGLAVRAPEPIPARSTVSFRCVLPGTNHTLRGKADVIWTDDQGRAGMFFSHLPPSSRKLLKRWLARSHAHSTDAVRILLPQQGVAPFSRLS